jgi:hypothetical protein
MTNHDLAQIIANPTRYFRNPEELLRSSQVSSEVKILALKEWDSEIRQLEVASEENMPATNPTSLTDVHNALRALGVEPDGEHSGGNKTGHI